MTSVGPGVLDMLKYYKEGKLSLAGLAKKLDLSISEAIDLLKERGIEAPIGFDDYLKGFEVFGRQNERKLCG
jgi:hypothetical protein